MKGSLGVRILLFTLLYRSSLSLSSSWQEQSVVADCGITALIALGADFLAGDKRGKIRHFQWNTDTLESLKTLEDEQFDSKPFPVFSMATTHGHLDDSSQLFCGGGDRFISVWEYSHDNGWSCRQRLGPHTGWVKDVIYDCQRDMLYSIGCNCIESWARDTDGLWSHAGKRAIESSREEGATLSSDLLCLCPCKEDDCFFAGGVDGRIHAWSLDPTMREPIHTVRAHDGRINVLAYAPTTKLLISSGHDGMVHCSRISNKAPIPTTPDAKIAVLDKNGDPARVTACCLLEDSNDRSVDFMLGTANGELAWFQAFIHKERADITENAGLRYVFPDEPVNNAICSLTTSPNSLAVGHSLGLSLITLES